MLIESGGVIQRFNLFVCHMIGRVSEPGGDKSVTPQARPNYELRMAVYTTLTQTGQQLIVSAMDATTASQNYLQLNVPPPNTCPKVKCIQFKCSSHDQGYAIIPGTSSYSWGDLVVQSSDGTEIYKQSRAYANDVANTNFQEHCGRYDEQDELVQKCAPGTILILVLNAQYTGWINNVRSGELQIQY